MAEGSNAAPSQAGAAAQRGRQAFISYARADVEAANALQRELQASDWQVFLDTASLRAGELWPDALRDAIHRADRFWLLWSKHAAASAWVKREYTEALALRKQWQLERLIQIKPLDDTPLPPELANTQALPRLVKPRPAKLICFVFAALTLIVAAAVCVVILRARESNQQASANTDAPGSSPNVQQAAATGSIASANPMPAASEPQHVSRATPAVPTASGLPDTLVKPPTKADPSGVEQNVTASTISAKGQAKVTAGKIEGHSGQNIKQNVTTKDVHASDNANVEIGVIK